MKVLVAYKRTALERYEGDGDEHVAALLEAGDASVAKLRSAHDAHYDTLDRVRRSLDELGVAATFHHGPVDNGHPWDLVFTVGGDGTLLWSSHAVDSETPMMAINSDPETSVGYFCAADRGDLEGKIQAALEGKLKKTRLARMEVRLNDEVITRRVLNDILFCHRCPGAATRYLIELDGHRESHTSSGIWVGPAAGSTAAQRSAGGKVLRLGSQRLQWVVREPYLPERILNRGPACRLLKGLVEPHQALTVKTKIREGRIFLDGASKVVEVDIGSEIQLRRSDEALTLLGLRPRAERSASRFPGGMS